jgi:hypothetical protein
MRLRVWVVLLLKGEVGCGKAFDIRQMPAYSRPLNLGALEMEGRRGDVPEAAFRVRVVNQNPNKSYF